MQQMAMGVGLPQFSNPDLNNSVNPNLCFIKARFNPWEHFPAGEFVTGTVYQQLDTYLYAAVDHMFLQMNDVMFSATGSRTTFTKQEILEYLNDLNDVYAVYYQLIGMQAIANLNWEAHFSENRPPEVAILADTYDLTPARFQATYGPTINALSRILGPKSMHGLTQHFYSPYTMGKGYHFIAQNHIIDLRTITNGEAYNNVLLSLVNGFSDVWATVHQAVRNYFNVDQIVMESEVMFDDPTLTAGIMNFGFRLDSLSAGAPDFNVLPMLSYTAIGSLVNSGASSTSWFERSAYTRQTGYGLPQPFARDVCLRKDTTPTTMDLIFAGHFAHATTAAISGFINPVYNIGAASYDELYWATPDSGLTLDYSGFHLASFNTLSTGTDANIRVGRQLSDPLYDIFYDMIMLNGLGATAGVVDLTPSYRYLQVTDDEYLSRIDAAGIQRNLLPGLVSMVSEDFGLEPLVNITAMAGVRSGRTGQEAVRR